MSDPAISVVVPARDAERYIGPAVTSVLAQTLLPREVIVVDDGSRDRTAAIAGAIGEPVRVLAAGFANIGAARNAGVEVATGAFLAFLDADDLWEPRWLELAAAALKGLAGPGVALGGVRQFLSPELEPAEARRFRFAEGLREAPLAGALMASRETLDLVGPFETGHSGAEFSDWFLRARDLGVAQVRVHEHTLSRRVHGANHTLMQPAAVRDHLWALKASLDRRRARGPA
ncbi:MAG: hypothetical protein QOJ01_633 [Solirubrobacterales bacterium]|jgi:glycosyltransferase involved in cell wall biosynthesis|nr:hypothetical protein [Solirubrobacterales bacterium]